MRNGNSRRDPRLVAAVEEMDRLLVQAADAAVAASSEYVANPRWCGRPPPDPGTNRIRLSYPWQYWMGYEIEGLKDVNHPDHWVNDEASGIEYHRLIQERLAFRLRNGLPPLRYERPNGGDGTETPRRRLDRIRGVLRWEHRLDAESIATKAFALLQVRKGRVEPQHGMDGKRVRVQTYEYVALPQADIGVRPAAVQFSESLHAAFRHAELALMPRDPTPTQMDFLRWMRDRGGSARTVELIEWIDADPKRGYSHDGQGTEAKLLRQFCEKDAPRGTRRPWRLRAAAYDLIKEEP